MADSERLFISIVVFYLEFWSCYSGVGGFLEKMMIRAMIMGWLKGLP